MAETSANSAAKLYLDDLRLGDIFESKEQRIDEADIIAFASLYDPQPFHTDPQAARDSFFGGLAASGWHTMGITMRLLVESMPITGGLIGTSVEISWPRPTRPGDVLRVRSKITTITPSRSRSDRGIVMVHSVTLGQDDEVRQNLNSRMLVFRRK